ncbi:MAG: sulfurtransferase TusA family protein, partial [Nitrospinales bacterium]
KGKLYFNDLLTPLKELPDIESSPHSYIDFGSEQKFSLEDRGQGECAGAVTDMIQDHLSSAERAVFQGKLFIEKGAYADSVRQVNRAVAASARALLVTEGMDFSEDLETLKKFDSLIIDMGIVSEKFADLTSRYQEDPESADKEKAEARLQEAEALIHDSQNAYNKLQSDKSLRIRVGAEDDKNGQKPESASTKTGETLKIDLLGVKCPFNYVKTKLKLETMDLGQKLEVLLDDGEPVKNVPKSVQNDGHKVLSLDKVDGHFKMVVEKV